VFPPISRPGARRLETKPACAMFMAVLWHVLAKISPAGLIDKVRNVGRSTRAPARRFRAKKLVCRWQFAGVLLLCLEASIGTTRTTGGGPKPTAPWCQIRTGVLTGTDLLLPHTPPPPSQTKSNQPADLPLFYLDLAHNAHALFALCRFAIPLVCCRYLALQGSLYVLLVASRQR
jgi:hypothetical protein